MSVETPVAPDAITSVFPLRLVADIVDVQRREHRIQTNEYKVEGVLPIVDQSTAPIAGYLADSTRAYAGPLPVVVFGDHTCIYKFVDFRFAVGADGTQLLTGVPGIDTRYLYYALHTSTVKQFGYQRHFKLLKQSKIPVPLDIAVQRRIASILGAYDDLIEVNRRRIAVLEEMARRLFEEWFVHFRFPGATSASIPDELPSSWSWQPMSAVCVPGDGIQTGPFGSQLHQADYSEDGVPVVMPKNIVGMRIVEDGIARIPERLAKELGRHLMAAGDVVYGRRGDIGRRAFISRREGGWFCGTGCLRLRPDPAWIHPRYFFDALGVERTLGEIKARAQGATMPNLSAGVMAAVPILVPPLAVQQRYGEAVEQLSDLVTNLHAANDRLAASRGLLLPRLISGDLPVAAAERELEAVA